VHVKALPAHRIVLKPNYPDYPYCRQLDFLSLWQPGGGNRPSRAAGKNRKITAGPNTGAPSSSWIEAPKRLGILLRVKFLHCWPVYAQQGKQWQKHKLLIF
jgi:hypothetical protein